jgi:hypothetical protein
MDKSKTLLAINLKLPINCVSQFKNMIKYFANEPLHFLIIYRN